MIDRDQLIQDCLAIEGWPYVSPGANNATGIDCSGMLVRGFKIQHGNIYHGSNRIVRAHCRGWRVIDALGSNLEPGMAVFKRRDDDAEAAEYKPGGRYYNPALTGNFYHVGLVASANPLRIAHATEPVAKIDTRVGRWYMAAYLIDVRYPVETDKLQISKNVNYSASESVNEPAAQPTALPVKTYPVESVCAREAETMETALSAPAARPGWTIGAANTPDGGRLNLRRQPTAAVDNRVGAVPNGEAVTVLETRADGWSRVQYKGIVAYARTEYITAADTERRGVW